MNSMPRDGPDKREAEFEMRREPLRLKFISAFPKLSQNVLPIEPHEMRKHETVVQGGSPTHQFLFTRRAPEMCDQSSKNQLLRDAHPRVRRHLESAHLDESESQ